LIELLNKPFAWTTQEKGYVGSLSGIRRGEGDNEYILSFAYVKSRRHADRTNHTKPAIRIENDCEFLLIVDPRISHEYHYFLQVYPLPNPDPRNMVEIFEANSNFALFARVS
jgi:hypothetical protein